MGNLVSKSLLPLFSSIRVFCFVLLSYLLRIMYSSSKLCFRKPVFVRCSPLHLNGFSSSSSLPQTPPCVTMYVDPCGADFGKLVIRRAGDTSLVENKLPNEEMRTIGTSNGWLTTLKDGVMGLSHTEDAKRISLPPLVTLPPGQTQIVTNVAMSTSSPEDEDCVVAVKFLGPQLSFCRPALGSNPEWVNIGITNPCFFSSTVVYSKKDEMFHISGSGGHIIGSWGLHLGTRVEKRGKFRRLRFRKIPNLTKLEKEILDSCYKSEHLVESRTTGETFMVKLYKKTMEDIARVKTEAVMVFKLDDKGSAVYTQDIGDLCIFLTKSESICVPSSSFPDMNPNHVEILHMDETAIFNLANPFNC